MDEMVTAAFAIILTFAIVAVAVMVAISMIS